MTLNGIFAVFAYAIGHDDTLSVSASQFKTLSTDSPAVLIVCDTEAEQQELLNKLTEFLRKEAA